MSTAELMAARELRPKAVKAAAQPQKAVDALVLVANILDELAMHHPEEGYVRTHLRELQNILKGWS